MRKEGVDSREALEAFRLYAQAAGKTMEETLNKAAGETAYQAMRSIPPADIQSLNVHNPNGRIGSDYERRLFHALAAKSGVVKGQGNKKKAVAMFNSRKRSRGFVGSIFVNMGKDFGHKLIGRRRVGPVAAESFGEKARARHLVASLYSGTVDKEVTELLYTAFDKGLRLALYGPGGMVDWATKRLAKQDEKYGSKKR